MERIRTMDDFLIAPHTKLKRERGRSTGAESFNLPRGAFKPPELEGILLGRMGEHLSEKYLWRVRDITYLLLIRALARSIISANLAFTSGESLSGVGSAKIAAVFS